RWRAAHRYGVQSWRNLWFLNDVVVDETPARHNIEENLALVRAICTRVGVPSPAADVGLSVHLPAAAERWADGWLAEHRLAGDEPVIGIHAFSSTFKNMHHKCWDADHFAALVRRLGDAHPEARFVLFSGPEDGAVNDVIVRGTGGRVFRIEEEDLRRAAAVLARCRLFVGN